MSVRVGVYYGMVDIDASNNGTYIASVSNYYSFLGVSN